MKFPGQAVGGGEALRPAELLGTSRFAPQLGGCEASERLGHPWAAPPEEVENQPEIGISSWS